MATLTAPIFVSGAGAVTPGGMTARQTCAAIRAAQSGFRPFVWADPILMAQVAAWVPAHWKLRRTEGEWLVNLAARAISEAMETGEVASRSTAILLCPPESFRQHPAFETIAPGDFLTAVVRASGREFHPASRTVDGGAAAGIGLLEKAEELLDSGDVEQVLLGGVDSMINDMDVARLEKAGRLKGDNSQGLIPGEGAVFVRLTRAPEEREGVCAAIHGFGIAQEEDSVLTERYSQGRAQLAAMKDAVAGAGPKEPDINFVVSNGNGERYIAWEQMIARARFFRTRREQFPTAYAAMTVGDVGSAGGALALLLAADSISKGYAPGSVAMCEVTSESGLRAAAVVSEVRRS